MTFVRSSGIDEICERALAAAPDMPWLMEPLTPGRGKAFILQHILRNRLLSSVIRPAWVSRCPDLEVVRRTIGQMREELVRDDAINQAHTALLRQMGRNVGLTDDEMDAARPVPLVEAAFNVWENIARTHHWIAGWLSSSVDEFILVAMPEHNFQAAPWKRTFQLDDDQVFFFSYHNKADEDHAGREVWAPIDGHLTDTAVRREVLDSLTLALTALRLFYVGICELGDTLDAAPAATRS